MPDHIPQAWGGTTGDCRKTVIVQMQDVGTEIAFSYVYVPSQVWHHMEMLTAMLYQSWMHGQIEQPWCEHDVSGGVRCRCGCMVYPQRRTIGAHSVEQTRPSRPASAATAASPAGGWKAWPKTMVPRAAPGSRKAQAEVVSSANSFGAFSADEHEDEEGATRRRRVPAKAQIRRRA